MKHIRPKAIFKNILLSITAILLFVVTAEMLCRIWFNPAEDLFLGLFEYDKDKIYALKRNIADGQFVGKKVTTNSFGYRDTEIPVAKGNRHRVLVVGDSVTFGHGVEAEQAYPEVLESMLNSDPKCQFDVINTAVPGNSPFQEYYDLKRGLIFKPDIVIIQFVLNDLIEPYKIFMRYGGIGIDYHGIVDFPYWHYFLARRSAFYGCFHKIIVKAKFGAFDKASLKKKVIQMERELSWNAASDKPASPRLQEAWKECFIWLQKEVDLCRQEGIDCFLLISFDDFQLLNPDRRYAQEAVERFCVENSIHCINFLAYVEEEALKQVAGKYRLSKNTTFKDILLAYPEDVRRIYNDYFLDYGHYSAKGHYFAAGILLPLIQQLGLCEGAGR